MPGRSLRGVPPLCRDAAMTAGPAEECGACGLRAVPTGMPRGLLPCLHARRVEALEGDPPRVIHLPGLLA